MQVHVQVGIFVIILADKLFALPFMAAVRYISCSDIGLPAQPRQG